MIVLNQTIGNKQINHNQHNKEMKIGDRVNKLVSISAPYKTKVNNSIRGTTFIRVRCDCGNEKEIKLSKLTNGRLKSCGLCRPLPPDHTTHGLSRTRLYRIYYHMKQRCFNKNHNSYIHYGGRGISVCEDWNSDFLIFYHWAKNNGYRSDLSIDRINVNGNYEPGNCRWVDQSMQLRNTRRSRFLTINGKKKNLVDWASQSGVSSTTISYRLKKGASLKEATSNIAFESSMVPVESLTTGESWISCKSCAESLGVSRSALSNHFKGRSKTVRGHKLKKAC